MLAILRGYTFKTFEFNLYSRRGKIVYKGEDQKTEFEGTGYENGMYI